jgi:hypothetical protein
MPNREIHNILHYVPLFLPVAATTDNTAWVSQIIDLANYNAAEFVIETGTLTDADATFAVLFEDGNVANLSDNATVDPTLLVGTGALVNFNFATDNKCRKIGYIGSKRYVRLTVTPANNTGNVFLGGVAVLGFPSVSPTPNPPQA